MSGDRYHNMSWLAGLTILLIVLVYLWKVQDYRQLAPSSEPEHISIVNRPTSIEPLPSREIPGTIAISYTNNLVEDGETIPISYRSVIIDEVDRYVSYSERISVPEGATKWERGSVDGERWLSQSLNDRGEIRWQVGRLEQYQLPSFLASAYQRGMISDELSKIRSNGAPIVAWETIQQQIDEGRLVKAGSQWMQSLQATKVVFQYGLRTHYIWFDDVYGIRLQHDVHTDGGFQSSLVAESVELGEISGIDYRPTTTPGRPGDYFELREFDPSISISGPPFLGDLLFPIESECRDMRLDASAYITGTRVFEEEMIASRGGNEGWLVGQELTSQIGISIFSLQGEKGRSLPFAMDVLWPPDWIGNPLEWSTGTFDDMVSLQFADSIHVDIYETNDGSGMPPDVTPLSIDYLATWLEGENIRVVLGLKGIADAIDAFNWAEAYRNCSQSGSKSKDL